MDSMADNHTFCGDARTPTAGAKEGESTLPSPRGRRTTKARSPRKPVDDAASVSSTGEPVSPPRPPDNHKSEHQRTPGHCPLCNTYGWAGEIRRFDGEEMV